MKSFELTLTLPAGGVLIGGYSGVPDGLHGAHAQDREGRPLIPATALRGALREALEALLRGAGEPACAAGDGVDPERDAAGATSALCTLDGGRRCKACVLFGTRRAKVDAGERSFSGLLLGDARLVSGDATWSVRPGVSISRGRRTTEDQRLFFHRVASGAGLSFVARGRLRAPGLEPLLSAAVNATTHIGAGRSRGLARVSIHLQWLEEPATQAELPGSGDVRVRVKLLSPALIGVPIVDENLRETRNEIPGAALRGAVGFSLAEVLEDSNDAAFQTLVSADAGAHFGFLYPVDDDATGTSSPLPITAAACKHHEGEHGVIDTLLDRLAMKLIDSANQALVIERSALSRCGVCGSPLRGVAGCRRASARPATRAVTRVSMDRSRASARDEHLFTQVLLDAGVELEGTIRNIPEQSRSRLAEALCGGVLTLGRGRATGWGMVDVRTSPAPPPIPLEERGAAFEGALRARLEQAGLPATRAPRLLPITLLSPLIAPPGDDGERLLIQYVEARTCFLKARRFSREGGWDQRRGAMEPVLATAAGGVFVLELDRGSWRDVAARLAHLERDGIGDRRHQGYGHLLCFDPFILARTLNEHSRGRPNMDLSQHLRPFRKALVVAAEQVMEGAFGAGGTKPTKAQLSHLVAVCNEAACTQEIENYIRYQAGRRHGDKASWDLDLAHRVIGGIQQALGDVEAAAGSSDKDLAKVHAWRLYAVFLARAFTYQEEKHRSPRGRRS